MFALFLAILASAAISMTFKLAEMKPGHSRVGMVFVNEIMALTFSLMLASSIPWFRVSWFTSFFSEMRQVFGSGGLFGVDAAYGYAVMIALIGGVASYLGMYANQTSTARNGAAMTVTFNKSGVIIPIGLSMLVFREFPTALQLFGVALALAGIIMIYFKKEALSAITSRGYLLATLFFGGFCDFLCKLYESFGSDNGEKIYLIYVYTLAAVIAAVIYFKKREKITKWDVFFGILGGILLNSTQRYMLVALRTVPGIIVFPVYSLTVIIIINIVNLLFFHEKLTKRQYFAMGLMVASILLLNL